MYMNMNMYIYIYIHICIHIGSNEIRHLPARKHSNVKTELRVDCYVTMLYNYHVI